MEIITTPSKFILSFSFNPRIVEAVKKLPGRQFNYKDKTWTVPSAYRREVEVFAHRYMFSWRKATNEPEPTYEIEPLPELSLDIPLKPTLRNYQRGGVAYNLIHKKVIVADDMGLGKTGQAIASIIGADMLSQQTGENPSFPCLVITLSSTKYHWLNQWQFWTGRNYAMILSDINKKNYHLYIESGMVKVQIVNYDSLEKFFVKKIAKGKDEKLSINHIIFDERIKIYNSIIIDECHKVKDESIKRSKIVKGIATGKNFILGLTGTPCINTPRDVGVQLNIIGQIHKFGGWKYFLERYCSGKKKASNLKELNYLLNKHCYYRRSKQEVAKELPAKSRQVVLCEITNRKEYQDAETNLIEYLRQYKNASDEKIMAAIRGQVMVQIGVLKNISAKGKIKDVIDFIEDTIEQGEKVVLFCHLHEVGHALKSTFHNCASITGEDDLKDRQFAIQKFRNDPKCLVAVCSIKAAGTGVDGLQFASSTVTFIELPWTAADCDQAEDRLNRIGQTKAVNAIYFLGRKTIDEHIYNIIQNKRQIADAITGNTDEVKIDFVNEIANLFNKQS